MEMESTAFCWLATDFAAFAALYEQLLTKSMPWTPKQSIVSIRPKVRRRVCPFEMFSVPCTPTHTITKMIRIPGKVSSSFRYLYLSTGVTGIQSSRLSHNLGKLLLLFIARGGTIMVNRLLSLSRLLFEKLSTGVTGNSYSCCFLRLVLWIDSLWHIRASPSTHLFLHTYRKAEMK